MSIHTEYQWRRFNLVQLWQQSLLRLGLNYHINKPWLVRGGYAWIENFPFGSIPTNNYGKAITEHRFYFLVNNLHKTGEITLRQRLMHEARFVGRFNSPQSTREDYYAFLNRLRYLVGIQIPLKASDKDKFPYLILSEEIFASVGSDINITRAFDQNRILFLVGYPLSNIYRLEVGYLNQIIKFAPAASDKRVFQFNHGVILNIHLNTATLKLRNEKSDA